MITYYNKQEVNDLLLTKELKGHTHTDEITTVTTIESGLIAKRNILLTKLSTINTSLNSQFFPTI
jgi:hypothetical protein